MLDGLAPGEYVCSWTTGASTNLATFCVRSGASVLPPDGAGVRTATAAPISLDTRIGLVKVVEGAATLRLSTRWDGVPEGVLTVNGAEAARLGAAEETDHVLDGLAPGEYVCQWTTGASTNLATFCVRGGASALPPDGVGVRTVAAAAITLDTRIGLVKVVEGAATLRLSTRWDGVPEGVLTVNGAEAARLGAAEETDHVLDGLAPGEYVCSWTTGASTNLATFCVRSGASVLPPDGAGVRTATAAPISLDTRIGLVKVVEGAATLRLSTRWDGVPEGVLTVNGAEAARLGAAEETDHVLDGLAPGEYVCSWTTGASTNLATFCVRSGASVLPPDGAGVRTATAAPISLDTRIGLVKVVEGAATLRLSTRWDGVPEGVLTVNGAEAARLGAAEETDHVLDGLAPGEYVCQWTTGASTNLATFCVRGGASALPPGGAGVRTATASPVTLDTRIGLYKVLPVSDRGVASAVCRLSTRWDGAESGTLTVNGEEVRALGTSEEVDHRMDNLAPGEYVCRWTAGDAAYLATFSVRGDGSARPPRTGVEVTITGHTATYAYDGREKRAGGFVVTTSDPLYTADDFVFTGCSNAVRTAVGTTAFGMSASDFANVNPDFADVVFHVVDGSVTVTPGAVVNPFDPDDPSAPPAPGALARADCVTVYDGEGHTISVAPLLNPALAADGAAVTYSPDPSRVPFAPENPVFTNAVSTSVWYRVASPNYAPFTTNALLEIRPRPVTLTSGTKTDFVYDGAAHTCPHIMISGLGFVAGEGVTASNWATVTTVAEGEVDNTFDYVPLDGTDLANYELTVVTGRIAVVAATPVTPGGPIDPVSPDPTDPSAPYSAYDFVGVYDGEAHTIDTNALRSVVYQPAAPLSFQYAIVKDGALVDEPFTFTDVVSTSFWYRISAPNFADYWHEAKVTITNRPVTLTSGTKTDFVYNGAAHACPHIMISGLGFVAGEGVTTSNWATVTRVDEGEVVNTFDYAVQEGTDLANYAITVVTGKIAVVAAPIPVGPSGAVAAVGYTNVYDGAAHGVAVSANGLLTAPMVQYRADEADVWADVSPTFGDVCDTQVWYRVSAPNYAPVVGSVGVRITLRPITLTSKSAAKVYDGMPLTAHEVAVGGDGFADGEGAVVTYSGSQTTVGVSENTFTYALNGKTSAGNYDITTVNGTLTVTKASIGGGEGGGGEPGEGDVPDGGLSKFDATAMYDGEGHTIKTNELVAAFAEAMIGESAVEYAADDGSAGIGGLGAPTLPWGAVPAYTNAGEYVVWYRVTNPNYEDFVHTAKVTIAKRPVTVRSRSRTKPYDGMPLALTADDIDVSLTDGGQGLPALPEGEAFAYGDFAERTAAGETAATFTVSAGADTRLENYEVTAEYGTLTVTKATYPGQEPGGAGIAWGVAPGAATWMYDGRPHGVALTGVPAGVTARLAGHEATDAGDYVATVALDYDAANYEPPAAPAPLAWSIARRPLTLMAASREKPYDGFPLAVRPGDITASGSGYADGECLDYFGFASITDVGETAATFSYRDSATAKAANYDVTVAGGQTLKVTVGGDQISVTADSATWAYDGEEHRAATWRVGNGDKLLAGHELRVAVDPASVVRTPADGPDGDGVVSNRFASVRIVEAATGADRTRNYNLVLKEGVLRMTNACIRAEQVFGADDVAKIYDGVSTQVVVTAELLQPARVRYFADGAAATSAALPEDAAWSGEPPGFTHATNATVRFTVEADYYNAYTGRVDVAIAKRAVTLTTPTKAKTYDGAPLTFGADEVELVATSATLPEGRGDGAVATSATLPEGESFVLSDFAAITDAGRVPARCAYVAGTGTRLSDYAVTEAWGTLTVLASADEITVTADSATLAYDGTAHRLPSYTAENADKLRPGDALDVAFAPESVVLTPEDGPDGDGVVSNAIASVRVLRHGTEDVTRNYSLAWYPGVLRVTKARMTFDGEGSVDPSGFSTAATYDGAGHTVAVVPPSLLTAPVTVRYYGAVATSATLPARGDGAVATSATLPARGDGAAATSATLPARGDGAAATSATLPAEAAWSGEAPAFTNAGVHTVFYALDARHYETYFGTATVTIAPRPVTLVSGGAEKVYDGTPLRCDAVRVKDGSPGFVDGEGFAATCSGALTDVGAMENLFDYALTGGAKADNYAVAKEYGWLRVTPATLDPGAVFGGGETDADGGPLCARVYNGAPQPFAPAPDFGEPYRLSYALVPGDESAYSETAPTRTHVAEGDLAVYFKFLSPNYAPYYGKGTLRIVPKALTEEMCVADEDAAWFFDGTEKRPAVTVVDGDPNIATADDYTLAYSGRTGAGLFPVTVMGTNDYCGVVTKEFAILKRPVAPPVIPSRAYSGRLQKPTIAADARWTVAANPGGTDAGLYTNVVLRLANTADYKWKGLGGDEADWTGVFEIRRGANGWSTYPGIRSWTNGVEAANEPTGRARFGTLSVAYRRRGAPVASETAERPSAPGRYTARFWVAESKNYAGVGLAAPYDVDFEIFRGPDDPPAGDATTTTPVPVPYAWLDAYVGRFGGGDYEAAAHAPGANGVALWESYVAGLDPADAASRFTASIALGADGTPVVTWSPDLRAAEPPRAYTVYGKPTLGAAAWTPVTDANRAAMRFFKVAVEVR